MPGGHEIGGGAGEDTLLKSVYTYVFFGGGCAMWHAGS